MGLYFPCGHPIQKIAIQSKAARENKTPCKAILFLIKVKLIHHCLSSQVRVNSLNMELARVYL